MATNLFEIPEWLDYANFDNYPSEENPTTNADFINYARNQNKLVGALTGALLWQPNKNFIAGKIIISPNMPEGMEAVALTGGVTGTVEPAWESGTEEYQDSGVKWKLRYKHWSKSVEEIADLTTGATNRLPNKAYAVGNVVYTESNLSVALKCITGGTTSNEELDISAKNISDTVPDGSVVWQVCNRTSDVTSVNGETGDVVVGEVKNLSINGTTVTVTFANGTTKTLTTQDSNTAFVPNYNAEVSVSSTSYTAPRAGIFYLSIRAVYTNDFKVYVNNKLIAYVGGNGLKHWYTNSVTAILNTGDVLRYEATGASDATYVRKFYPFKAV